MTTNENPKIWKTKRFETRDCVDRRKRIKGGKKRRYVVITDGWSVEMNWIWCIYVFGIGRRKRRRIEFKWQKEEEVRRDFGIEKRY